jgi:hypothetical protein
MSKKLILEDENGNFIDLHPTKPKVVTEDLGKIFEMAICLLYKTPYDGKFNYSMLKAEMLKDRIANLKEVFEYKIIHTAKNGARYDFTGADSSEIKLSAKTTKKDYKVCPQVIGQPSKKKFCEHFGLDLLITTDQIKEYIVTNIEKLLKTYFEYTFDCPIVYYNEHTKALWFIKKHTDIDWDNCIIEFSHIKKNKIWNESSSVTINGYSMGEVQVHNHRDNIKFRWNLSNLLYCFHHGQDEKYFEIIDLNTLEKKD